MSFNLPKKEPQDIYDAVPDARAPITYTSAPVSLMSTGIQNIMQLPADLGAFIWTGFTIRTATVTGAGTPAAVTAGWGGTPTQILSSTSVSPSAADKTRTMPNSGFVDVIPDNTQLAIDVVGATTGYSAYSVVFEITGYHV